MNLVILPEGGICGSAPNSEWRMDNILGVGSTAGKESTSGYQKGVNEEWTWIGAQEAYIVQTILIALMRDMRIDALMEM